LRDLEGVALLLQELIVERSLASLFGLLFLLTSSHLSLRSGNLCRLVLKAKIGDIHAASLLKASGLSAPAIHVLRNSRSRLRSLKALRKLLVAKTLNGLTLTDVLGVKLLAHVAKLRTSAKVLRVALLPKLPNLSASAKSLTILLLTKGGESLTKTKLLGISLLAKSRSLLGSLLLGGAVSLRSRKPNALLLRSHLLGLPIARLKKIGQRSLIGEALLASKIGLLNASAVATKCARLNGLASHSGALLGIFLRLKRLLGLNHIRHVRIHVLGII
jgi:hypothetical protein